jgi:PAS domain S-box-containing protein
MHENPYDRRKIALILLLVLVPALFFLGWSQASLNLSFIRPSSPEQTLLLLSLSAVIFLAFVIFALILLRILLKLYVERRQQRLGARFKTTMVVAFLGLSVVPVCFLFAFAYGLLNRTIDRWFGIPLDLIRADSQEVGRQLQSQARSRSAHITHHLASKGTLLRAVADSHDEEILRLLEREVADLNFESAMCFDRQGRLLARAGDPSPDPSEVVRFYPQLFSGQVPQAGLSSNWRSGDFEMFVSAQALVDSAGAVLGTVVGATRLPVKLMLISQEIEREGQKYAQLSSERRAVKRTYLSMLCLLTLLILFIATWFALFLAKQVTVPIQALAEATQEVSRGNLGFQVSTRADDELGILIHSFNAMTRQLQENRLAIEQAAKELQAANRQLEERGNTIEAILENIPTGVISFDPEGQITRVNKMAKRMFGRDNMGAVRVLADLFTPEDTREVARLFRRASRQGAASRQMELDLGGRRAFTSLTVSSVRARHGKIGSVLVLEDLSELVQAQKAAAWQEVAQRMAHEIKNPLTPIQLSTERIGRLLERAGTLPPDLLRVVSESASLVGREVATLKSLVDEFSAFARFPASKPIPSNLNEIVENALRIFDGRLSGIEIHQDLSPDLPLAQVDPEQMKRAVANLIDNAAEALEHALQKEIWVRTALDAEHDVAEITVADSGPGIAPEDKEKLFLPFFSTKHRGTGLGLAIVSRIVAEQKGIIRVEENQPTGTKFIIELPVERAPAAQEQEGSRQ